MLPSLFALGGLFIGWYGLVNFQLYTAIHQLELSSQSQTAELAKVENYLQQSFGGGQK